jgi:hypothetical protein
MQKPYDQLIKESVENEVGFLEKTEERKLPFCFLAKDA